MKNNNKKLNKDNIIFTLLVILFIWIAGLTAYSLWQFNGIESNYWDTTVRINELKLQK